MSDSKASVLKKEVQQEPSPSTVVTPEPRTVGTGAGAGSGVLRRWKREDLLKRGSLWLRGIALLFSLISFILVASNNHGDWRNFVKYEEYRYLLAIAIISSLYTGGQVFRQALELSTGQTLLQSRTLAFIDFVGDQVVAYLLISSTSSAIPMTNRIRVVADNIFTDTSAAAISMSFFAFLCLAISAIISGHKLSAQTDI
ncbi:CASP-like protein 4B4 [Gastrolobium bilobum]|uniref:CASP-like protein 4B4 n=1 Tax=Gastrolobium bilobum TaxID=150636 RepID=UPI002AB2ADC1|nr:CASP-like protein 4B4 [Gastrolobium bilobum]